MSVQKKFLGDVLSVQEKPEASGSRNLGGAIEKVKCYSVTLGELATEAATDFVDEQGNLVKINLTTVVKMFNLLWATFKQAALQCNGKNIVIKLPKNPIVAGILKAALAFLKIDLFSD